MSTFSLEFQGRVAAALDDLGTGLVNLERIGEPVGDALRDNETAWLDSEGEGSFEPLTDDYEESKARTHPGKTILRRDDNLYKALTEQGAPDAIYEVAEESISFGVGGRTGEILAYHQAGTKKMAARKALNLTDEGVERISEIVHDDIAGFMSEVALEVG